METEMVVGEYLRRFLHTYVGANVIDGSHWGFCSYEDFLKLTKMEPSLNGVTDLVEFSILKSNTGVLVRADANYVISILNNIDKSLMTDKDVEFAEATWMAGKLAFRFFINDKGSYEGFIGVNEISDATTVTVSQVTYPSFKVDIREVMDCFSKETIMYLNHQNEWVYYDKRIDLDEFAKSFTVSPTRNCMVLPIKLG